MRPFGPLREQPVEHALRKRQAATDLPDVSRLLERVRVGGDTALRRIAAEMGDAPFAEIPRAQWQAAYGSLDARTRSALRFVRDAIRRCSREQMRSLRAFTYRRNGIVIRQRIAPIEAVGVYVPGGRYPLPSSALMTVVPARVAGSKEIVACTPRPAPITLAALHLAGADRLFVIGGAHAIAAMAYGTRSIPAVDKIVGPGNAYVAAAKRALTGICGFDLLAGPSELMIIASDGCDPSMAATDLLAQAEHDADAKLWLVTASRRLARAVNQRLAALLEALPHDAIARRSLAAGTIVVDPGLRHAARLADAIAPEHLQLQGRRAEALAASIRHCGTLIVGAKSGAVYGDYAAGPDHVLPTAGSARFSGGLSPLDFIRIRMEQRAPAAVDPKLVRACARMADAEGLTAHRLAALARLQPIARAR